MKKRAKYRRLPKFERMPDSLRKLREQMELMYPAIYARFYGKFITTTGMLRRFSFQVKLDAGLSGQKMYKIVREIVSALLLNKIPRHRPGEVFSVSELEQARWVVVRKVLQYKVGMVYG